MSNDDDLSDALEEAGPVLQQAQHPAHRLHAEWVKSGKDPDKLSPLIDHFRPKIKQEAMRIAGGAKMVNQTAVEGQLMAHAVKAFETWDPNKGAALTTHVINNFKPARRFVIKAQNVARIPEADALQIGSIQRATAQLSDQHGRAPTLGELAAETGLTERQVKRIQRRQVADVPTGAFEVDAVGNMTARDLEIQPLLRDQLPPRDQKVFDLIYPSDGASLQHTGQIAKKLGMKDYQVSESKSRIADLWKRYR